MLKPKANHGRPPAGSRRVALRRGARRLAVESLESRLMLSANTADIALGFQTLSVGSLDLPASETSPPAFRLVGSPVAGEGGFVGFDLTTTAASPRGIHLGLSPVTNFGGTSDVIQLDPALTFTDAQLFSGGDMILTAGPNTAAEANLGGIRPAVIVAPDIVSPPSAPEHGLVGNLTRAAQPDNGGTIAIESILRTLGPGSGFDSSEPAVTKLALDTSDDSLLDASPRLEDDLTPQHATVSGEWARALVFELAGGEPSTEQPTGGRARLAPAASDDSVPAVGGPFSSADAPRGDQQSAAGRSAAEQSDAAVAADELRRLPSTQSNDTLRTSGQPLGWNADAPSRTGAARLAANSIGAMLAAGWPMQRLIDKSRPDAPDPTEAAHDAVLAQWADEADAAGAQPPADDSVKRGSFDAMPILLALGLERLLARTSRTSGKQERSTLRRPAGNRS